MRIPAGLFKGLSVKLPYFLKLHFYRSLGKSSLKFVRERGIDLDSIFVKLTWVTICVLLVVGLVLVYKNDYFIKKYKQDFFNVGLAFLSLSALFVLFPIFPIWIWIITWFDFSLCKTEPMK